MKHQKHNLKKGDLTYDQSEQLKQLDENLSDDLKQYSLYLVNNSHDSYKDQKKELLEIYKDKPIIKWTYKHERDPDETVTLYYTPISSSEAGADSNRWKDAHWTSWIIPRAGTDIQSFDKISHLREYIDEYPELAEKAELRDQIGKIKEEMRDTFKNTLKEDRYTTTSAHAIDRLVRSGNEKIKSSIPDDELQTISNTLHNIDMAKPEDIQLTTKNLNKLTKDLEKSKQHYTYDYDIDQATDFIKKKDKYKEALKEALQKAKLKESLIEKHGWEPVEQSKLPEGFILQPKSKHSYDQYAKNLITNKDESLEIEVTAGRPGESSKFYGEVYYTVPDKGRYSIGRRGIDSGIHVDWKDQRNLSQLIKDIEKDVDERKQRILGAIDVSIGGRTWNVQPENIKKYKKQLDNGENVTFMPHGFGIGLTLSRKPSPYSKIAPGDAKKTFGSPLFVSEFDAD